MALSRGSQLAYTEKAFSSNGKLICRSEGLPERDISALGVMGWGLEVAGFVFRRRRRRRRRRRHRRRPLWVEKLVFPGFTFFSLWALERRSGCATAGKLLGMAARVFLVSPKILNKSESC